MDQIARYSRLSNNARHYFAVSLCLRKEKESWRRKNLIQVMKSDGERYRRRKHLRMSNDTEKLVDTGPWDRPRSLSLGQFRQQISSRLMVAGRNDLRINEHVCVDGLRVSATIHHVKEVIPVEQVHTGLFDCLPAAEDEP